MSQTKERISLASARVDSSIFGELIQDVCERILVVGSVRRGRPEVGDIEYVVIPKYETVPGPGLFGGGEPVKRNMLWMLLDDMVEAGTIGKALRGKVPRTCWGDRQRAVWFRGMTHEIFLADEDNWGSTALIRTGPADFSRFVVTELRRCGMKHEGGRIIKCSAAVDPVIKTPTEQDVFDLIGIKYREPRDRVKVD